MAIRENRIQFGWIKGNPFKGLLAAALVLIAAAALLSGCGSGGDDDDFDGPPPVFEVQILSDPAADGDIAFSAPTTHTISSALAAGNVLVGIDPDSGDEFRGFLDFPLRGPKGVPTKAVVESATLEIFINNLTISEPNDIVPLLIDLVIFQPPTIVASDFDRVAQPALLTMPFDIIPSDAGTFVVIDVTALMDRAQLEGLPDFQLRILLDFSGDAGLVEFDDDTVDTAPILTVTYF